MVFLFAFIFAKIKEFRDPYDHRIMMCRPHDNTEAERTVLNGAEQQISKRRISLGLLS